MSKRYSFATTIIGNNSLLREGIAKILRSANFRIVASVSSADDLPGKVQAERPLFLIVHTGDDFDFAAGQIEFFRDNYPEGRIAIVAVCSRGEALDHPFDHRFAAQRLQALVGPAHAAAQAAGEDDAGHGAP